MRQAIPFILTATLLAALGCNGGGYTLRVDRPALTERSASTAIVVDTIDRVAMSNGFFRIATHENVATSLVAYRADIKNNDISNAGIITVTLSEPTTGHFILHMTTSPDFDYPRAGAFRSQVTQALKQLLPDASISGF